MSLINCSHCGHLLSTSAPKCPGCGEPAPASERAERLRKEVLFCTKCGVKNSGPFDRCSACGAPRYEAESKGLNKSSDSNRTPTHNQPSDNPPATPREPTGERGGFFAILMLASPVLIVTGFFVSSTIPHWIAFLCAAALCLLMLSQKNVEIVKGGMESENFKFSPRGFAWGLLAVSSIVLVFKVAIRASDCLDDTEQSVWQQIIDSSPAESRNDREQAFYSLSCDAKRTSIDWARANAEKQYVNDVIFDASERCTILTLPCVFTLTSLDAELCYEGCWHEADDQHEKGPMSRRVTALTNWLEQEIRSFCQRHQDIPEYQPYCRERLWHEHGGRFTDDQSTAEFIASSTAVNEGLREERPLVEQAESQQTSDLEEEGKEEIPASKSCYTKCGASL